jgi:hypothetical protein
MMQSLADTFTERGSTLTIGSTEFMGRSAIIEVGKFFCPCTSEFEGEQGLFGGDAYHRSGILCEAPSPSIMTGLGRECIGEGDAPSEIGMRRGLGGHVNRGVEVDSNK